MKHLSLATALTLAAFSTLAAPLPDPSKLPPASKQEGVSFDKDIHPILDEACVRCHGEQRPKAGLQLNTLEGVMKGSKDNQVVVASDSSRSRLVFAVASIDGKIFMPPKPRAPKPGANGATNAPAAPPAAAAAAHPWKALTPEQVGLIRAWIDQGAKP